MLLLLAGSSISRRLLQDRAHCAGTDKGTKSFEQKASFVWFCTWNDTTPSTTQKAEIKHVLLKKKKKRHKWASFNNLRNYRWSLFIRVTPVEFGAVMLRHVIIGTSARRTKQSFFSNVFQLFLSGLPDGC